jgi:hypothetical protein
MAIEKFGTVVQIMVAIETLFPYIQPHEKKATID